MLRNVQLTPECKEYVDKYETELYKKFKYSLQILTEQKVIHIKIIKKLVNTNFYELRISTGKEHRIILFSSDHQNLIESKNIVLLNGFIKKSTKDYKKAIATASKLLKKYKIDYNE